MNNQNSTFPPENQKAVFGERHPPWNPYQILGFVFVATTILAGIALGLNWKRLKKPEWQVVTILLSVLVPALAIAAVLAWANNVAAHPNMPTHLVFGVPYMAFGINFGYIWALARLQNGAYKAYQAQGPDALSNYEYDLEGAVIFGAIVALILGVGGTFIFPLIMGNT